MVSFDVTPWTGEPLYTALVMKKYSVSIALTLTIGALVFIVEAAPQPPRRAAARS